MKQSTLTSFFGAKRPPAAAKFSEKRSERASKRPRGPRGRYLPQEESAVMA